MTPTTMPTPCFCTSIRSRRMRRISASDGAAPGDGVVVCAACATYTARHANAKHNRLITLLLLPRGLRGRRPGTSLLAQRDAKKKVAEFYVGGTKVGYLGPRRRDLSLLRRYLRAILDSDPTAAPDRVQNGCCHDDPHFVCNLRDPRARATACRRARSEVHKRLFLASPGNFRSRAKSRHRRVVTAV